MSVDVEEIKKIIRTLSKEEVVVLNYFIRNRSVGELLALRELRGLYGIREPMKIINKLVDKGLLERGIGCYNISRNLIKMIKERKIVI